MSWTPKDFEPEFLSSTLVSIGKDILTKSAMPQSQDPSAEAKPIEEYEGRMKATGVDKLGAASYVSLVGLFANQGDLDRNKPKGALIIYMETENAARMFKGLGIEFPDDEDDVSMMAACGKVGQYIAQNLTKELSGRGYASLVLAPPQNYKNSVVGDVAFSREQKTKHEISFFYSRHKVLVMDLTLAPISKK